MSISRNQTLGFRQSHAFVIGINEYRGLDANLKTAVQDSEDVALRLKALQGFDNVLLMNNVGKSQAMALLDWLKDSERPAALSIPNQSFGTAPLPYSSRIAWLKLAEELEEGQKDALPSLSFTWNKQGNDGGPQEETVFLVDNSEIDIQPEDSIVFYYAGHGFPGEIKDGPAGYLTPTDARNELVKNESLIPMDELYKALSEVDCKHTLLLLDCCFAGKFRFATLSRGRPKPFLMPLYKKRYERYKTNAAWQVLASAGPEQTANDSAKWAGIRENSPFAATLREALEGRADLHTFGNRTQGDGVITATELFLYVWNQVEKITGEVKPQHPGLFPMAQHREGEFIFINPNMEPGQFKFARDPDKNPYKGLLPYEPEDANLFFGRDQALASLLRKVDAQREAKLPPVIFITAPSAAGKSSLAKAGLFPALRKNYGYEELFLFRPAPLDQVVGATITAVENVEGEQTEIKGEYQRKEWTGFSELLAHLAPQKKQVILVDQFEEFFTEFHSKEEQAAFEEALLAVIEQQTGRTHPLIVLFTMRSDAEWQMPKTQLSGATGGERYNYWTNEHLFRLQPMDLDQLREALTGPAWWALYDFKDSPGAGHTDDGEVLINQILKDVAYCPAALPLLSCVMQAFYKKAKENGELDPTRKQQLIREDYEDGLGGVAGALSANAQAFYLDLSADEQLLMRKILLRMADLSDAEYKGRKVTYAEVNENEAGRQAKKDGPLYELDYGEENLPTLKSLIDKMEAAHLLVQGKNHKGLPTVEPAHDALINHWSQCRQWVEDFGKETLPLQRQLWEAVVDHHNWEPDEYTERDIRGRTPQAPLWDNNPKLQQLQRAITDPTDTWLCKKGWADLSLSSFSYLLFGQNPSEEQLQVLAPFEEYLLTKEEQEEWKPLNGREAPKRLLQPEEVYRRILALMDPWMNEAELAFVKKSFEAQQSALERAIAERDKARELQAIAEQRQKEVEDMARKMGMQMQAFKQKYKGRARRDLEVIKEGRKPNLFQVLAGIDDYPENDKNIRDLTGCVKDVETVSEAVRKQEGKLYNRVETHLLANSQATEANIMKAIGEATARASVFDYILVLLSGHSKKVNNPEDPNNGQCFFYSCSEGLQDKLFGREICEALMKSPATVILIVDFCYGAEFLQPLIDANKSADFDYITHSVFGLSGTSYEQNALESREGGFFSQVIRRCFETREADLDGNGMVYLDEVYQFCARELKAKNKGRQDVFVVSPSTMTNIPLLQLGDTFAFPMREIALSGHIEEEAVIQSIDRILALFEPETSTR